MFNLVKKLKKRPGLWPYLFEFFTVLFSVYLAFLITQWREQKKINEDVRIAMERLNMEIFLNYKEMIEFKQDVDQRLRKIHRIEEIVSPEHNFRYYSNSIDGFRIARFRHSAWDRIANTNLANLMPVEYVERVHVLYQGADALEEHNVKCDRILYSSMMIDKSQLELALDLSDTYISQQSSWAMQGEQVYREFIEDYKECFEPLLAKDKQVYSHFQGVDSLKLTTEISKQ